MFSMGNRYITTVFVGPDVLQPSPKPLLSTRLPPVTSGHAVKGLGSSAIAPAASIIDPRYRMTAPAAISYATLLPYIRGWDIAPVPRHVNRFVIARTGVKGIVTIRKEALAIERPCEKLG